MKIKNVFLFLFSFFAITILLSFNSIAFAIVPTLSATNTGSGDSVRVTVNGDAGSSVLLSYNKTGQGLQLSSLGNTDSSGYFSTTISTGTYGVASGASVYVVVNSQQSTTVAWPYTASQTALTLSQTSSVLSVGQSATITAGSSTLYLSNNSNSPIANVSLSGSQITITANSYGSTTLSICAQGSTTNCGSIYVTVQNSRSTALSFSQSSLTISSGQTVPITISGGNGVYYVLNNSNSSSVQASVNGSIVNLSTSSSSGASSITICSNGQSSCGIINVTVGNSSSSSLSFSQTNPSIATGQTTTVTVSGGSSGAYYVSANSVPSVIQATLSGNSLSLYGITTGTSVITVCSSVGSCGSLTASVNYLSTGGNIALSQNSISLLTGQALSVTVSGGTAPYNLSLNQNTIFQASVNGNVVTVTGLSIGTSSVAVCSAERGCTTLSITVNGTGTLVSQLTFSQNNLSLVAGQNQSITMSGNGGYYVSSNSSPSVASAIVNGNALTVSATNIGNTNISICQTGGQCSILYVSVLSNLSSSNSSASFLTLSSSSQSLVIGQNASISLAGGVNSSYSITYNSNSSVVSTSISGSSLTVSGIANGTAVIVVCSSNNSCAPVSVSVGPLATTSSSIILSQSSASISAGKGILITISGSGGYYVSSNSSPSIASIAIVSNKGIIAGVSAGTTNISICQSGGQCASLAVSVSGASTVVPNISTTFKFTSLLYIGSTGAEVLALQKRLAAEGYYGGSLTGTYGTLTSAAVKLYQKANGIRQTGNVGDATREALNSGR